VTGAAVAAVPSAAHRQRAEVAGYRSLWRAAPPGLAARHGLTALDVGDGVCTGCAAVTGTHWLNHAIGVGVAAPATDGDLDEMERFYAHLGVRATVAVAGGAEGLDDLLARRGYVAHRPWMTFHREAGAPDAPETRLRTDVAEARDAAAFGGIVAAGFGLAPEMSAWFAALVGRPGWTCLLARDGRVPVGAAAMYAHDDSAWFTLGATLPEHRGRGAQGALFAARAARASAMGLRHLVTETGLPAGPSYRNMLRAGFREAALRPNLLAPAPGGRA